MTRKSAMAEMVSATISELLFVNKDISTSLLPE